MALDAVPRVAHRLAEHRLAVAAADEVHSEDDGGRARGLRALDHRLRLVPVGCVIELEPDRCAARGDHVFDRRGRDGGEHLQVVLRLRGARDGQLTFGVERLLAAERAEDDRRAVLVAEQIDRGIELADVHEAARAQRPLGIAVAIRLDGGVVVGAGDEVAPVRGRNLRFRDRLEIEDVERFAGGADQARFLRHLVDQPERFGLVARGAGKEALERLIVDAGGDEERRAGEEAEEFAAGEFVHGRARIGESGAGT